MRLNSKSFIFSCHSFICVLVVCFTVSCVPEAGPYNPANYELYISISSDFSPSVSPDGKLIAYSHKCLEFPEPIDYPTGLYVMDFDGNNRKLLLEGNHWSPSWSPDCQWLVFTSAGTLQIINLNGDSIRTFDGLQDLPLFSPDWSIDGKEILFSAPLTLDGGVFKMSPDFLYVKRILNPQTNNGMYAKWSPDRSMIVYEKGSQSFQSVDIFTIDTALQSEIRLTNDDKDDRDADWSPNGNLITWTSNVRIMVMNIDGTEQKVLDYGQYPSWSPKSDYIIYSFANSDFTKEVLWKIDIDGSDKTQLTF